MSHWTMGFHRTCPGSTWPWFRDHPVAERPAFGICYCSAQCCTGTHASASESIISSNHPGRHSTLRILSTPTSHGQAALSKPTVCQTRKRSTGSAIDRETRDSRLETRDLRLTNKRERRQTASSVRRGMKNYACLWPRPPRVVQSEATEGLAMHSTQAPVGKQLTLEAALSYRMYASYTVPGYIAWAPQRPRSPPHKGRTKLTPHSSTAVHRVHRSTPDTDSPDPLPVAASTGPVCTNTNRTYSLVRFPTMDYCMQRLVQVWFEPSGPLARLG